MNFKIVIVLYSITFVYLAYQAVIVIGLLQSGLTLSAIRELFTSSDLNLLRQSNYMVAIQNFIATPTVYLAIAILPIEWFKGNRNKIFIEFKSVNSGKTKRIIHPAELFTYLNNWYVAEFCELRNEIRQFKLKDINSYKILDKKYEEVNLKIWSKN